MFRILLLANIFFSLAVSADFYLPSQVSNPPLGFDAARSASLDLTIGDLGCSATVISNQGHILTALHCLEQCIGFSQNSQIHSFRASIPKTQNILSGRAGCQISVQTENGSTNSYSAKVVAVGPGLVIASDYGPLVKELTQKPAEQNYFLQLMKSGIGISGDFAIIKVDSLANRCVRLASRAPTVGEAVWTMGYPAASFRESGYGTQGGRLVFSSGTVTWSAPSNFSWQTQDVLQLVGFRNARPGLFVSDVDSNEGSSGSGIFSSAGELIGVLNSSAISYEQMARSNSAAKSTSGGRYSSSVEFIRNYTSAVFGQGVSAAAFSCQ